jgi:GT2 family glycosyltransferase
VLGNGASSFWVVGAVMLVRATAFDEVGGFDETFFLYSEETDLSVRMRERGWTALACDDAVASHLGAESTGGRQYRHLMGLSRRRYIQKHWRRRDRLALSALLPVVHVWNTVYVLGRIVFTPRSFRAKRTLWAAHWDNRTGPRVRDSWRRADV